MMTQGVPGFATGEQSRTKWGSQPARSGLMISVLEMDVILEQQRGPSVTRLDPCSLAPHIGRGGRILRVTAGLEGTRRRRFAVAGRRVPRC